MTTKSKVFELVLKSVPYPEQISHIDMESMNHHIEFVWRETNYIRININDLKVEFIENDYCVRSDICMIFEALLKKADLVNRL